MIANILLRVATGRGQTCDVFKRFPGVGGLLEQGAEPALCELGVHGHAAEEIPDGQGQRDIARWSVTALTYSIPAARTSLTDNPSLSLSPYLPPSLSPSLPPQYPRCTPTTASRPPTQAGGGPYKPKPENS